MKLKNALLHLLAFGGLFAAHAHAALVDQWTAGGGAWTASAQSGFVSGTGGVLAADPGSASNATLSIANATSGGIYTAYYYTLFSTPTFTLTSGNVLADIATLSVTIHAAGTFASAPSLIFNGNALTADVDSFDGGTIGGSFAATTYVYTWEVGSFTDETNAFSIGWTFPVHTAIDSIVLTQAAAVPEPSTYAAFAGAGVLLIAFLRRRRA